MDIKVSNEVEKFIYSLDKIIIAKVLRTLDLLEKFGHQLRLPHSRMVRKRLFELRVRGQQEVRIFYIFQKDDAVLLHGFIKKSQITPLKELKKAVKIMDSLT